MLDPDPNIGSRQITAVDALWREIVAIGQLPPFYFDILTEEEYVEGSWISKFQMEVLSEYIDKMSSTIGEARLYLPDELWNSFVIARTFVGRLYALISLAKEGQSLKCHWTKDKIVQDLLTTLWNEKEYLNWKALPVMGRLRITWERLEYKILYQCRDFISVEFEPQSLPQNIIKIGFQPNSDPAMFD